MTHIKRLVFTALFYFLAAGVAVVAQPYENLVFEGAGMRGLAYSGVLKQLEDHGILTDIKRVGGTSAGAITAVLVSLGYNSKEIYQVVSETKFQKFNDGEYMFVGGVSRMSNKYGWYKGDEFNRWLEKLIADKTGNADITFKELKARGFKQLYVTGTSMNKQKLLVFSAETYPNMKVRDGVRISMSIPLYFEAVFIDGSGKVYEDPKDAKDLDIVVDGGLVGNFPIFMFDSLATTNSGHKQRIPNFKTIGVRMDTDEQIKRDSVDQELTSVEIENLSDYINAFYILMLENVNRNQLTKDDWARTISVSCVGIGQKIKKLSAAEKASLIKSGEDHTKQFLERR